MRMEHFWDLLFQLMKHGTNISHVTFIFLFSVVTVILAAYIPVGGASGCELSLTFVLEPVDEFPCRRFENLKVIKQNLFCFTL